MTTTTLESLQNEVIRDVLNVRDVHILKKLKNFLRCEERKTHEFAASQPASAVASAEVEPHMAQEEILANFDQACTALKLNLDGTLELKPAEELLNEV